MGGGFDIVGLSFSIAYPARQAIEGLLELDFERVILAHGAIIERDGPALVRQTFEGWLL